MTTQSTAPVVGDMPEWVSKAVEIARHMVDTQQTDHRFGYHAVCWLADALDAAERKQDDVLCRMASALSLLDERMGDTDPLDEDDPLLLACQLLSPIAESKNVVA